MSKKLTKEEVELFAAGMVKRGELIWAGFRQDADEKYTIPELTPSVWTLIHALLATQQPEPRDEVTDAMIEAAAFAYDTFPCPYGESVGRGPHLGQLRATLQAAIDARAGEAS